MKGAIRRFDKNKRILYLSEVLGAAVATFNWLTNGFDPKYLNTLSQNEILTNETHVHCAVLLWPIFCRRSLDAVPRVSRCCSGRALRY